MKERILKEDISYFADTFPFSAALEGKTIAVTGATGLLGACMVRCLLALRTEKGINLHVPNKPVAPVIAIVFPSNAAEKGNVSAK